jgi:hypothetical protein
MKIERFECFTSNYYNCVKLHYWISLFPLLCEFDYKISQWINIGIYIHERHIEIDKYFHLELKQKEYDFSIRI